MPLSQIKEGTGINAQCRDEGVNCQIDDRNFLLWVFINKCVIFINIEYYTQWVGSRDGMISWNPM